MSRDLQIIRENIAAITAAHETQCGSLERLVDSLAAQERASAEHAARLREKEIELLAREGKCVEREKSVGGVAQALSSARAEVKTLRQRCETCAENNQTLKSAEHRRAEHVGTI